MYNINKKGDIMRKKVRYYVGEDISQNIIREINLISRRRYEEGLNILNHRGMDTLQEMCYRHNTQPHQENVILGEDWYIIYSIKESKIEILEWLSVKNVPNKIEQTVEMLNEIKKILLKNENTKIFAYMRHSTSYRFYQKFLSLGYFKELQDSLIFEKYLIPKGRKISKKIERKYGSLEEYLKGDYKEFISLENYIYHGVEFEITDKFTKRYCKSKK